VYPSFVTLTNDVRNAENLYGNFKNENLLCSFFLEK
jgi:hypothetical protein